MSYQVLARKWRPRNFPEMVGQMHVRQALTNALENQRLHHAYLFTGTRGVGKTTIARIFSKSLNCESKGITAYPCGECAACQEIDGGRFVDLIEVDAASRTKVEDTREILENVQYAPTRGRFKVYLIDEVHMLSTSSFNALLKTLEEPPPHVKFLLATTDPQRLPPTILSRCLQFNLKRIPLEQIDSHLTYILQQEQIEFEPPALQLLAQAADGSLRDALSLLDQAIAYGGGQLSLADVSAMLGTLDQNTVLNLLNALAAQNAPELLKQVAQLAEQNPDFRAVLADMLSFLQKIALTQAVPESLDTQQTHANDIQALAQQLKPEDTQLFYQIALLGRRDLPLSPEPRGGFEMILLRMLAFKPLKAGQQIKTAKQTPENQPAQQQPVQTPPPIVDHQQPVQAPPPIEQYQQSVQAPPPVEQYQQSVQAPPPVEQYQQPVQASPSVEQYQQPVQTPPPVEQYQQSVQAPPPIEQYQQPAPVATDYVPTMPTYAPPSDEWGQFAATLPMGMVRQLAENCALRKKENNTWFLGLAPIHKALQSPKRQTDLEAALQRYTNQQLKIHIYIERDDIQTPALEQKQIRETQQQYAESQIQQDPFVQTLQQQCDAQIQSVTPVVGENDTSQQQD
ncbi:DNA polymerase III subunit gamma/tau [Candidatus Albibeggiatoa sp. nov. NOAA]|uniref:DNA polymerase III subunit gamma/tau n=1 Tax=Candidatus Albibeggiatoa sp. nov. NOAA TaxID=3162724 RepID=UPI0032FE076E|nr:DNA polymerase III subunit gamma/tau [Thiotrichaceae bacterium]